MQVNKILIPNKPHLDPIAAIYILGQYGSKMFPGVETAKIIYWNRGDNPSAEELQSFKDDSTLTLDIGGGDFDHHGTDAQNETVTCLVAKALGIENNPELSALLSYVREDDLEGMHNRFGDLAYIVKSMYKQNYSSNEVINFTVHVIGCLQEGQKYWHYDVKNEYDGKVKKIKVNRNKNKITVAIIESDNAQVGNYGITADKVSVVIQKRSNGQVMILTNKHHRIDLREIVAAIRKKELEQRGYDKPLDAAKLKFEGKSQLIPIWFYHKSLNSILNGSDALNKTEPTMIPFNDIIRFVVYGISTDHSELCDCGQGSQTCPYAPYGFSKCEDRKRGRY